jgi:hypothetical protein
MPTQLMCTAPVDAQVDGCRRVIRFCTRDSSFVLVIAIGSDSIPFLLFQVCGS